MTNGLIKKKKSIDLLEGLVIIKENCSTNPKNNRDINWLLKEKKSCSLS